MTYRASDVGSDLLLNFDFRRRYDGSVLSGPQCRKIDLAGAPTLVAQGSPGGRLGWHVAYELDHVGIARGRFGEGAFHAVDHRLEGDVAGEGGAALVMQFAHCRAPQALGLALVFFH